MSLPSYDLMMGHRWVVGSNTLFVDCGHHADASLIPIEDASRLLLDRCSALLLARERLFKNDITIADAAIVTHCIAMTQLAMANLLAGLAGKPMLHQANP